MSNIKPTQEYILQLLTSLQIEYAKRVSDDKELDLLYFQENKVEVPANIETERVKPATAFETVARIKGVFTQTYPTIQVIEPGLGEASRAKSAKVENFLNALFPILEDERNEDVWEDVLEDVIRMGRGCCRLLWLNKRWEAMPKREGQQDDEFLSLEGEQQDREYIKRADEYKRGKLPFRWQHIPVTGFYPIASEEDGELAEVVYITKRRLSGLKRTYKNIPGAPSYDPFLMVEFIEYWNSQWCGYFMGGLSDGVSLLRVWKHRYGRPPFAYIKGQTTTSTEVTKQTLSVLEPMKDLIGYEERLITQRASLVRLWCWATAVIEHPTLGGQMTEPPPKVEIKPSETVNVWEGTRIYFLAPNTSPAEVDQQVRWVAQRLQRLGLDVETSTELSGYAYATMLATARARLNPIANHLRRGFIKVAQLALDIVDLIGDTVYVYGKEGEASKWLSLSPSDIKGYRNLDVRVMAQLPTDKVAMAMLAKKLTEGEQPLIDRNMARERYLEITDPQKVEDEIRIQQLLDSPPIQQFMVAEALKRAGMKLEPEQGAQIAPGMLPPALEQALGIAPGMPLTPAPVGATAGIEGMPGGPGGRAAGQSRQPSGVPEMMTSP